MEQEQSTMRVPRKAALGWERQAVTFRLTDERKRALRALSGGEESISPTSALDLAIELAVSRQACDRESGSQPSAECGPIAQRELRELRQAAKAAASEWAGARALLTSVAADCAELRSAIAEASAPSEHARFDEPGAPRPIREWLDQAAASSWLVARARWIGTRPAGQGTAVWTLEVRELGRDGAQPARIALSVVELGPAAAGGPISRLNRDGCCVLSCSRASDGWTLSLRQIVEAGKLGEPFAELLV